MNHQQGFNMRSQNKPHTRPIPFHYMKSLSASQPLSQLVRDFQ